MKTRVPSCCNRETFATREEAQRRLDRMHTLGLRSVLPIDVERCMRGWHLRFPTKQTGPSDKLRALVEARDSNRCVRCGKPTARDGDSLHHRLPRGRGGGNTAENLILLDGSGTTGCHGWVEKNRAAAYRLGYLVETGIDPADVPVAVAGQGWRYPTADGRWVTLQEYGRAPGVGEDCCAHGQVMACPECGVCRSCGPCQCELAAEWAREAS
ncbi:HNH endonuclease [Planotetraspora sp. A-T 1434]|uniref:HNH endonuclease n=1 Tax=Planotetraspora sp. A-T 1434 TaxID=2979219 RepID=UPI0021C07C24|nr:HNH endonuclease signature motif containing protein [Planotetraspora sp. A-T 1434]MCT9932405.1 HNH endonuclease [Planotetraspora sp. A-T 1434]